MRRKRRNPTASRVSSRPVRATDTLRLLKGGDRRSIGRANEVADLVFKNPTLFPALIRESWSEDRLVRMRAADAIEKATRTTHSLLQPYKQELLDLMKTAREPELRWHLAEMVPRLWLTSNERKRAIVSLSAYLQDHSSIVKTSALQGLADFAQQDPAIRAYVIKILHKALRDGTSAMKARSRKLLIKLEFKPTRRRGVEDQPEVS